MVLEVVQKLFVGNFSGKIRFFGGNFTFISTKKFIFFTLKLLAKSFAPLLKPYNLAQLVTALVMYCWQLGALFHGPGFEYH